MIRFDLLIEKNDLCISEVLPMYKFLKFEKIVQLPTKLIHFIFDKGLADCLEYKT